MINLEINVDLLPDKHTEFMQSWQTFIEHIKNTNGLEGFELNQSDDHCRILLRWHEKQHLNEFTSNKWYSFIMGAVKVLGAESSTIIQE